MANFSTNEFVNSVEVALSKIPKHAIQGAGDEVRTGKGERSKGEKRGEGWRGAKEKRGREG